MKNAVVIKKIASLKSKPDFESENLDEVLFGMNITILKELENKWYYVRTHYNYEGYIDGNSIIIDENISDEWQKEKNAVVINNFADVLNKPEASGYVIVCMTKGAHIISLNEVDENNHFVKVKLPDSRCGWVRKDFLGKLKKDYDLRDEESLRNNLVKSALGYMGTQYRWGGKSPEGVDCSGLCSMAYMLNGILIYRDANIKDGFPIKEISKDDLKKGDLIFFPGHVAMYIGHNKYVHSATRNDVVAINSFNKESDDYFEYLDKVDKKYGSIFV